LGTSYAGEGKYARAQDEWNEIVEADPEYAPARQNLVILQQVERWENKGSISGLAHEP